MINRKVAKRGALKIQELCTQIINKDNYKEFIQTTKPETVDKRWRAKKSARNSNHLAVRRQTTVVILLLQNTYKQVHITKYVKTHQKYQTLL